MTSTKPNAPRKIRVSVISDIMCPWCYVASTEIDNAIEKLQLPDDAAIEFELEHKPYILNSSWTEDHWEVRKEYGIKKFGEDRWNKGQQVLKSRGEAVGIRLYVYAILSSGKMVDSLVLSGSDSIVCNPLRAHRLLRLAWNKGGSDAQSKLLKVLYQATFERGENVSDIDLLAKYAMKIGFVSDTEVSFACYLVAR